MSEITTMMTKLGNKRIAVRKDEEKIKSLDNQIEIYQNARAKTVASLDQKKVEIEKMDELVAEYKRLEWDKKTLIGRMNRLQEKYNAIPWRPDLLPEEKIENSEFDSLAAKVAVIQERLNVIPKDANRVYYRRVVDEVSGE